MAEFEQTTLPGIPEKERERYIPRKLAGKFTAKQRAFVAEYIATNDAEAAALKAGYSPKNPRYIAYDLLHKSHITEAIKAHEEEALRKAGISRVRALLELSRLVYANPRQLYREDNTLKEPSEWDDDVAATIASVEVFEEFEGVGKNRRQIGKTKKVKQWNKSENLKTLLQHLGLLKDIKEISGGLSLGYDERLNRLISKVTGNNESPDGN
jgi:phage terminase small subunit